MKSSRLTLIFVLTSLFNCYLNPAFQQPPESDDDPFFQIWPFTLLNTPGFSIGGNITGLSGQGLVLQNNGGDNLNVPQNATTYTFNTPVSPSATYSVSILTQPTGQTCTVANATGPANANITDANITCTNAPGFTIAGNITGLTTNGLVLQNNGADNLTINSGTTNFTFSSQVSSGGAYAVTILSQPSGLTCSIANGTGTASSNITNVNVTCSNVSVTVGGSITGLNANGLVLQNNGADNLTLTSGATNFTFNTALASGGAYAVTILSQPSGLTCSIASGTGTASANITNVSVTCSGVSVTIGGTITGLTASGLVLQNNGANNLTVNSGVANFSFPNPLAFGSNYGVTVQSQPTGLTCTVSNGSGTANTNITTIALNCTVNITVATPTFSPAAGTYSSTQNVTISTTTGGAQIRYTNDGSTPTCSTGTIYSSAVSVAATTTLKAIGCLGGATDSAVATAAYTINLATGWYTFAGDASGSQALKYFKATSDGGVLAVGWSNTNINVLDGKTALSAYTGASGSTYTVWIVKYSSTGTVDWHTYGARDVTAGYFFAGQLSNGTYIVMASVAGPTSSHLTVGGVAPIVGHPSSGFHEAHWVANYNTNGTMNWNSFRGTNGQNNFFHGGVVGPDDSIYSIGYVNSATAFGSPITAYNASNDAWMNKWSTSGSVLWHTYAGGSGFDYAYGVSVASDGSVYWAGQAASSFGSPLNAYAGGTSDLWLQKLNSSGAVQWTTFAGSSGNDTIGRPAVSTDGSVYLTGTVPTSFAVSLNPFSGTGSNLYTVKYNSSGAKQWDTFTGASAGGNLSTQHSGIEIGPDGNIVISSQTSTAIVPIGGQDVLNAFAGTNAGYIIKYNPSGGLVWHTCLGASGVNTQMASLAISSDNSIFTGFRAVSSISSLLGKAPVNPFVTGGNDAMVIKLLSTGGM